MMDIKDKYYIKTTELKSSKGYWSQTQVDIHEKETDNYISGYVRTYSSMYNTFVPFQQDGKDYALISVDYTATSVMSLPDGKIIAQEPAASNGFCPVDFFVPTSEELVLCDFEKPSMELGTFGFVAGCVWGDETSWKIQFLDLSDITKGIIRRDDRFGYIELPHGIDLIDAISFNHFSGEYEMDGDVSEEYPLFEIATGGNVFNLKTGKLEYDGNEYANKGEDDEKVNECSKCTGSNNTVGSAIKRAFRRFFS